MFHEQSQAPSDHSFGHVSTIEENIQRFKKYGKIINRVAKNNSGEVARIGKLERENHETIYLVFYPDGEFDRFESGIKVEYRDEWTGPDLSQPEIIDQLEKSEKKSEEQKERKRARARELYAKKKEDGTKVKTRSASQSNKKRVLH
jgi:hypothetical protein